MYNELERIYKEAEERGELRKAKEVSLSLAKMGFPIEKIAQAVKISQVRIGYPKKNSTVIQVCIWCRFKI